MTLIIPKVTGQKLTLAKTYVGVDDPDAAAYVAAVEAADGQSLETAVQVAIHSFVKGCKADGIWPAIKASCILAGARTLAGALIPLVGATPTKQGTEGGWNYNRETGLKGNGTDNYLNSAYSDSTAPLASVHQACYSTSGPTADATRYYFSVPGGVTDIRITTANALLFRNRNTSSYNLAGQGGSTGFLGHSRSLVSSFIARVNGNNNTVASSASSLDPDNYRVLELSDARLAFYSIGESIDLALLDSRVTDLMNALGAAIP